ncbi:MAG: DUF4129 domain-containing protein [Planctomycetota bacterium]|jgi:hypothetical protein
MLIPDNRNNRDIFKHSFVVLLITGIAFSSMVLANEVEIQVHKVAQFERVDAETIKMHTRQILSDNRFSPRKTFWQWLIEKLSKWEGPRLGLGTGWAKFVLWFVFFWCILTLVAILIHLIWTILILISSRVSSSRVPRLVGCESLGAKSFEELCKIAQELAGKRAFREAIGTLMLALLRWLDSGSLIRFHESKTNGDYIREYPTAHPSCKDFKKFVIAFEQTVYGGLQVDGQVYRQMNFLLEQIRNHANQRP